MGDNKNLTRVFVYGTLKQGHGNNYLLKDSKFIGKDLVDEMALIDIGPYPVAVDAKEGSPMQIQGEVYEVDEDTMRNLDALEGYPHLYSRKQVRTVSWNDVWIYYHPMNVNTGMEGWINSTLIKEQGINQWPKRGEDL